MYQNEIYTNTYINSIKLLDKYNKIGVNYIKGNAIQIKIDGLKKIRLDLANIIEYYNVGKEKDNKENTNKSIVKVRNFGKKSSSSDKENTTHFVNAISEIIKEVEVKIYRLNAALSKIKSV